MKALLTTITLIWCLSGYSQKIQNVRITTEGDKVAVYYDLDDYSTRRTYTIDIKFQSTTEITPFALSGDVGEGVLGGKDRKIVWDLYQDIDGLQGNLKAQVSIKGKDKYYAGPSALMLSVLYPGLGDYFVRENKAVGILYNIAVPALLLGSVNSYSKGRDMRSGYPNSYSESRLEDDYFSMRNGIERLEKETGDKREKELGKANAMLIAGVSLWVLDIVMVGIKGKKNRQINPYFANIDATPRIQMAGGEYIFGVGLTFKLAQNEN